MKSKQFGKSKRSVPVIGQGTWNMPSGGNEWDEAVKALRRGIDIGMVHLDTAEMYGSGKSETMIAEAIAGLPRDQLFIVSKVLPQNATFKGTIQACERSLKRLKTDYLDCYLLHWRGSVPLSETMQAMEKLVDDGKILSLGVSNFDVDDLEEAKSALTKHAIACNQVLYNLYQRGIERKLVPYCNKNGIAVVGYTPFAQRGLPGKGTAGGAALAAIAEKHKATMRQVILSFLVRESNCFTIPKAAKVRHVEENAGAGDFELDHDDIAEINEHFPAPKRDIPLETL